MEYGHYSDLALIPKETPVWEYVLSNIRGQPRRQNVAASIPSGLVHDTA